MGTDKNTLELSRIDYLILGSLKTNDATTPILGLTIKEMDIREGKRSCIWKHLHKLIEQRLVCQSGTYGKQKMYYITQLGVDLLKGETNYV